MVNTETGRTAFGNWKCNFCGWTNDTKKPSFRPKRCPSCRKAYWEYVEIEFQDELLSGHTDFLSMDNLKKWVGWELKTTSLAMIERMIRLANSGKSPSKDARVLPYKKHIVQIETYCALLWRQYRIKVDRYVLVYTSREKPDQRYVCPSVPVTKEMIRQRLEHIDSSTLARKRVKALVKPKNRANLDKNLDALLELRPCHSVSDYRKIMKPGFEFEPCPVKDEGKCACSDVTKLRKELRSGVKEYLKEIEEGE